MADLNDAQITVIRALQNDQSASELAQELGDEFTPDKVRGILSRAEKAGYVRVTSNKPTRYRRTRKGGGVLRRKLAVA